ncbi:unnamed protein product [Acanthosepion pharaonis]|uniref:Uncharacterized protein n=1 Tax=Acanthosepion pharaonis TaxID=158019 RepID=A0A812EP85_ACAPH|nr:unnamed protein product [Sepia pharaonis]
MLFLFSTIFFRFIHLFYWVEAEKKNCSRRWRRMLNCLPLTFIFFSRFEETIHLHGIVETANNAGYIFLFVLSSSFLSNLYILSFFFIYLFSFSIYFIYLSIYLSIYLYLSSLYIIIYLSIYLSISVCTLSIYLSIYLSSIYLSIYISVCALSIDLSIYQENKDFSFSKNL